MKFDIILVLICNLELFYLKKVILFVLAAIMAFSLLGCDAQPTENVNEVIENNADDLKRESSVDEGKPEETEKPIEEAKETEAPVVDENKLIDGEGCMYEINTTYTFPNSIMTVKRLKLVREYFGYLMYFDFDVENTSDTSITWRIQDRSNLMGHINTELLKNDEIGGNNNYHDDDFTGNREDYNLITVNAGETYSCYKLGLFDGWNWDLEEPNVALKEREPMTITLYYKENDIKYPFEIKLNQDQ